MRPIAPSRISFRFNRRSREPTAPSERSRIVLGFSIGGSVFSVLGLVTLFIGLHQDTQSTSDDERAAREAVSATGGLALGLGAVLLTTALGCALDSGDPDPRAASREPRVRVRLSPVDGGAAIIVSGSF